MHQRTILLQEFKKLQFVSNSKTCMLVNNSRLSMKQVELWFENKRIKVEKKKLSAIVEDESEIIEVLNPF